MKNVWNDFFPQVSADSASSAISDLFKVGQQASIISFAGGFPAPECFPVEDLAAAAERAMTENPIAALQYGLPDGYAPLRAFVAERMTKMHVPASSEQILITSGSQQVLDLIGRLILEPGAPVAVEAPTFLGVFQAWQPYSPRYIALPLDEDGLQVDALASLLAGGERPRFLYLVSSFQNPTGVTLSPARKQALIELAGQYSLPIIEDDPYGDLYYSGSRPPTLAALDVALHGEARYVLYMGSFSKLLSPGLRVGWGVAPAELVSRMAQVKQGIDVHASNLAQTTIYEACRAGLLERHIPHVRAIYRERRDVMLVSLDQHMPEGVNWTRPEGGMFIWLTLPEPLSAGALLRRAIEERVAFVPGTPFYASDPQPNTLRLNFSHPKPDQIQEGVARLGRAIKSML